MLANIFNRKIKENEQLDAATKLAQKVEMERLQRLQEIQEQMWQQAALDLCTRRQQDMSLLLSDLPAVKSEASVMSPPAVALPTSLLNSSVTRGNERVEFVCRIELTVFYTLVSSGSQC